MKYDICSNTIFLLIFESLASSHGSNAPPVISPDVAFLKLEQKFNSAMFKIAELSSVNEELEHVNVQLQEETETVGEKEFNKYGQETFRSGNIPTRSV